MMLSYSTSDSCTTFDLTPSQPIDSAFRLEIFPQPCVFSLSSD